MVCKLKIPARCTKIGAAVDVSTRVLGEAAKKNIDLLIVHHGLFWPGLQSVTGALRRQLKIAFENDIALYSAHLPLDMHSKVGNNAQLAAALGLKSTKRFLKEKGQSVGLKAKTSTPRSVLIRKLKTVLGGPVKTFNFGPKPIAASRNRYGRGRLGDLSRRRSEDRHVHYRRSAALGGGCCGRARE